MSDNTLSILCDQRRRRLQSNVPPVRFELFNPYLQQQPYTQNDLNMRRKVEILKYSSNKMGSQTNSLTKKQKWAQLVNGNYSLPVSQFVADPSSNDLVAPVCPSDDSIPMLTTVADVPGPPIYLVLNKNVPLYNYAFNNRSYPFNVSINNALWKISTGTDTLIPHNEEKEFFTFSINTNIDQSSYNFNVISPFGIFVMGVIENNSLPKSNPVTLTIYNAFLNIYYSNNLIRTISVPPTLSSLTFNVEGKTGSFNAVQYVGNLNVPKFQLFTEPGYIYDMKLMARISVSGSYTNYFSSLKTYAYANISVVNNAINNCNIISQPSQVPNMGFSMVSSS